MLLKRDTNHQRLMGNCWCIVGSSDSFTTVALRRPVTIEELTEPEPGPVPPWTCPLPLTPPPLHVYRKTLPIYLNCVRCCLAKMFLNQRIHPVRVSVCPSVCLSDLSSSFVSLFLPLFPSFFMPWSSTKKTQNVLESICIGEGPDVGTRPATSHLNNPEFCSHSPIHPFIHLFVHSSVCPFILCI